MDQTLQIIQIVIGIIIILLFLVFTVLVLQVTKLIKLVTSKMDKLEAQINDVKLKVIPAIDNIQTVVHSVNKIVTVVEANTIVLTNTVEKIDGAVDGIIQFEQNIQARAEVPIMETINSYSALVTGVKAFFSKLGENRSNGKYKGSKRSYYNSENAVYSNESSYENDRELDDINSELDLVRRKLEEMRKD